MQHVSIIELLNLPVGFGYVLLILGLVLALAPWLQGSDFGILKIPDFSARARRALLGLGPLALAGAVALHVPFLERGGAAPDPVTGGAAASAKGTTTTPSVTPSTGDTVSVAALPPATQILIDWKDDGCLYRARVLNFDNGVARLELGFGEQVDAPPLIAYLPKPTQSEPGTRVWIEHDRAWTPGIIRTVRENRVLVDFDTESHCAGFLQDTSDWTDAANLSLPQQIGLTP